MAAKPLLASEVLRDEAAPLEPARTAARLWSLGAALAVAAAAVVDPDAGRIGGVLLAVVLLGLALVRLPYAARALTLTITTSVCGYFIARGSGPLVALDAEHEPWRTMACVALPAAIWFRGHYRHYWAAHLVLALGVLSSLPYAWQQLATVLAGSALTDQAAAAAGIAAVALAPLVLVPQLRSWTLVFLVLLGIGAELGARANGAPAALAVVRAGAQLALASAAGLGLFQLFAWATAGSARRGVRVRPETDEELEQRISVG